MQSVGDWVAARETRRWRLHHRIVGILYAILGVIGLGLGTHLEDRPHGLSPVAIELIAFGALQVVVGIAFAVRVRWARVPLWPLSVLYLFAVPIGTAMGAYTLWVLYETRPSRNESGAAA